MPIHLIDEETRKLYKIKSIICSIYLCYYIRLNEEIRAIFDSELYKPILKIVNAYSDEKKDSNNNFILLDNIKNEKLKMEIRDKNINNFSDFLKLEEDFLLNQIKLSEGIGKNVFLKENLFLLFLAAITKIPLIIIGKPGTSKSLSVQLINNSMKGKFSENEFFKKYPNIMQVYFQGSETTKPEDILELFKKAEYLNKNNKINKDKNDLIPIIMILFDELGLADKSPTNSLKVLHSKLEYNGKNDGLCFIGISNYSLDASKINRALILSPPNIDDNLPQLRDTAKSIVESISKEISNDTSKIFVFYILSRAYYLYKYYLNLIKKLIVLKIFLKENKEIKIKYFREIEKTNQKYKYLLNTNKNINIDFHGNRDFYNLIKGVAMEGSRLNNISEENHIVPIIENYIERNFGGITYKIDIDFEIQCEDIREEINKLKEILKQKFSSSYEDKISTVTSVNLFKKIYNEACRCEKNQSLNLIGVTYMIEEDHMDKYNIIKCIDDNINDNNSRYLLLGIKPNLSSLMNNVIKIQKSEEKEIIDIGGSPFSDDNNVEYNLQKVYEIQKETIKDKLIIIEKLDQIQAYLYDLYNMNYHIIDEQKYVRICLDNKFNEVLTPINDAFKIIILAEQRFINSFDLALLNRLEKMEINFQDLLDEGQNIIIETIMENIRLTDEIKKKQSNINYNLDNLLINCNKQEIGGLVYYFSLEREKKDEYQIIDKIYDRISDNLPQDIIVNLSEDNPLKKKYYERKRYPNFKEYIKDLKNNGENQMSNYKMSIIYTFSDIANIIEGADNENRFMISEIKSENDLKNHINDIKIKNNYNFQNDHIIIINFDHINYTKIQFVVDYISNYIQNDDYKYILIVHIQRIFDKRKQEIIYSIPNIYNNINQLFIDNLQGPNLLLKQILKQNIKDALFNIDIFQNLDNEFRETLINFVYENMPEKNNYENSDTLNFSTFLDEKYGVSRELNYFNAERYTEDILNYMNKYSYFKKDLINKAKELLEYVPEAQELFENLVNKIIKKNYINKKSIDIISCTLDYIKDNIFKRYLLYILKVLEDNNFLTTVIEIEKDKNIILDKGDKSKKDEENNNKNIIKELFAKVLKEIKINNNKYIPKFLFNYKIPGFYNFYKELSDFLNKNISNEFYDNEKKLRYKKIDSNSFYIKENYLLNIVLEKIKQDIFYFDLINKIAPDLILEDYIIFYLEKYKCIYSLSSRNIIELLLNLKFTKEKEIIKNNLSNPINIIILKIIWIESNIYFIKSIIESIENVKLLIKDINCDELNKKIYNMIYDNEYHIQYIYDKKRNPEFTREVNECFYILLAKICLYLTSKNIKLVRINIKDYHDILKIIFKIFQKINYDLKLYLNELYIVDELIKIIEYQMEKEIIDKKNIELIREKLIENCQIIQMNKFNKTDELIKNFIDLNQILSKEIEEKSRNKFYDTLKYIYMQEINKVNEITYQAVILAKIMEQKEIVKKSNDIFQILLKPYIQNDYFIDTKEELLNNKNDIIKLINKYLSNYKTEYYLALSETIIYFFEKNSLIYLNPFLRKKRYNQSLEEEPLQIFKDCNDFLFNIKSYIFENKNANVTKLFCLGYIKSYCYTFIKMHDKPNFNPEKIIKEINMCDKIKMVKLYIYKIIFNQNNKLIDIFSKNDIKEKYKLDKYNNFNDLFKFNEENYLYEIYNDIYDNDGCNAIYKILSEYQKNSFKNEICKEDIITDYNFKFDDFFMASSNLILNKIDFENDEIYLNFYNNVIEPLFKNDEYEDDNETENNKLFLLFKLIFEIEHYKEFKNKYKINQEDLKVLLNGYRYCLNELSEKNKYEEKYIYSYLYSSDNFLNIDEYFYPGVDINVDPYDELYYQIKNHFKKIPNQGCYACLCNKGYYHSVPTGFPSFSEINMICPNCKNPIGSTLKYLEEIYLDENKVKLNKNYEAINRKNYFRIFKDRTEINRIEDKDKYYKLKELNYMTIDEFKAKYINLNKREERLNTVHKNDFKKENKKIRNLSQISYRLLNYIFYSHLFFAELLTGGNSFKYYIPKGMTLLETIKECFFLLKKELEKNGIKKIDIFMNFIFHDLFQVLHNKKCINNFEALNKFENELENLIQDKINLAKKKIDKYKELEINNIKEDNSVISILKEINEKDFYKETDYPYYEHFYYTDYLDEEYLKNILENEEKREYPILNKYLEYKKRKKNNKDDKYFLTDFPILNEALNLINEEYYNKITREYAEKIIIKNSAIYNSNKELIEDFIDLYNSLGIKDSNDEEILNLDVNMNCISDFLLIDDNKFGKSYKKIYKKYIEMHNKELEDLFDIKINKGIFNNNCKIKVNVQQLKENEIFTFDPPKKFNFISVVFNSSYRKIIDTQNYENYNQYVINFDSIEDILTDLLLKNKKLISDEIKEFSFNNEIFSHEIGDLITNFYYNYPCSYISIDDKLVLYYYVLNNYGNNDKYRIIIDNFITLIKYLNKIQKEENKEINGFTIISNIDIIKDGNIFSNDFLDIFRDKKYLIVKKIPKLLDYYLKIIFKYIKQDIEKYQEKKEINIDKIIGKLDKIFKKDNMIIKKESLARAIRIFISLVLYREDEKNKDKRIKFNKRNIVDYLKSEDLWESNIYRANSFRKELEEIQSLNIKINEILWFYYYLTDNKDERFEDEVKEYIKKSEEKNKKEFKNLEEEIGEEEEEEEEEEDDHYDNEDDSDEEDDNIIRRKYKRKIRNNSDSD